VSSSTYAKLLQRNHAEPLKWLAERDANFALSSGTVSVAEAVDAGAVDALRWWVSADAARLECNASEGAASAAHIAQRRLTAVIKSPLTEQSGSRSRPTWWFIRASHGLFGWPFGQARFGLFVDEFVQCLGAANGVNDKSDGESNCGHNTASDLSRTRKLVSALRRNLRVYCNGYYRAGDAFADALFLRAMPRLSAVLTK
jgi:hypothetical protein